MDSLFAVRVMQAPGSWQRASRSSHHGTGCSHHGTGCSQAATDGACSHHGTGCPHHGTGCSQAATARACPHHGTGCSHHGSHHGACSHHGAACHEVAAVSGGAASCHQEGPGSEPDCHDEDAARYPAAYPSEYPSEHPLSATVCSSPRIRRTVSATPCATVRASAVCVKRIPSARPLTRPPLRTLSHNSY